MIFIKDNTCTEVEDRSDYLWLKLKMFNQKCKNCTVNKLHITIM
jgi:hypothetical protein